MIKSKIIDGSGSGKAVDVVDGGALLVSQFLNPPLLPQKIKVFSQKFSDDGLATGTTEMGVDGSVTPVDYYIEACKEDCDRYIATLSIILGYGSSADLYEFADSAAQLTNGIKLSYEDTNGDEITIMNPKANFSFQRASFAPVSNVNWESRGFAAAGDYGYFTTIDLTRIVPPYGVKLDKGTNQRIKFTIRDDCTDADLFNCAAFGFDRFE